MNTSVIDHGYAAIPVLFSSDLRLTTMFYSDGLGFAVHRESDGLRIRRDELDLKVAPMTDAGLLSNLSVVFRVNEIEKLHKEFSGRSLPNLSKIRQGICGKRQFSMTDPDKNSLYFVEAA
ncbi:VOC family protein [Roseibium aggregatum]|uniref:Glyoxalase/fosfomycin resistance/dioxygenase domain-containing protein n=1 Tax=Roseibium aggregatum TaxID=187304 RepID=A0A939EFX4_9HYPH|nr:VOC family protein [Roseibium aggregatum]MBN9671737.1 hypothetical protein [Roseibium aggregatum]